MGASGTGRRPGGPGAFLGFALASGSVAGLVSGISSVAANHYVHYRMRWLILRTFSRTLDRWLLIGLAVGLGIGILALGVSLGRKRLDGRVHLRSARWTRALVLISGAGVLAAGILSLAGWWASRRLSSPPIVLITVDTLRADHLGCYGYPRTTSPHLDALARSGHVFLRAYSHAPITSSSFSSIFTGFHPRETGTYGISALRPGVNTLAEYLSNAGYRTGAVVSNYVLRRGMGFEAGFDSYDDRMKEATSMSGILERTGAATTRAAKEWLRRQHGRPFFLWVHYQDPHGPYTPPAGYRAAFLDSSASGGCVLRVSDTQAGDGAIPRYQVLGSHRNAGYYVSQYDAEIRYMDDCLDSLVTALKAAGIWQRALIVFTSDHGEGMGEQDYYFAHGDYLLPGLLHVPLILWCPGEASQRDSTMVQSGDIICTVLDWAGIRSSQPLPGRDLRALPGPDAEVFSETYRGDNYKCSITARDLQVIYDRFNDDVRACDPVTGGRVPAPEGVLGERYRQLVRRLESQRNDQQAEESHRPWRMTREEIERLRSLGYVN